MPIFGQAYLKDFVGVTIEGDESLDEWFLFESIRHKRPSISCSPEERLWNPVIGNPWVLEMPLVGLETSVIFERYLCIGCDSIGPYVERYYSLPTPKKKLVRFLSENNWGDVSAILALRQKNPSKSLVFHQEKMNGAQIVQMFDSFLSKDSKEIPFDVISVTENSVIHQDGNSGITPSQAAHTQISGLLSTDAVIPSMGVAPEEAFFAERWQMYFNYLANHLSQDEMKDSLRFWQGGFQYATDIFSPYAAIPDVVFDEDLGFGEDVDLIYGKRFRKIIMDGSLKAGWDKLSGLNQSKIVEIVAQAQADWIVRTYLELSSMVFNKHGWLVERAFYQQLVDSDTVFTGFLKNKSLDYSPKKSWYWVQTLKNVLGDFYFRKDISAEYFLEGVRAFQFLNRANELALVLWMPTSVGQEVEVIIDLQRMGFGSMADVQMVTFKDGEESGIFSPVDCDLETGLATITVKETPIILKLNDKKTPKLANKVNPNQVRYVDLGLDYVQFGWDFPVQDEQVCRKFRVSLSVRNEKEPMVVRQVDLSDTRLLEAKMGFDHLQPGKTYHLAIECLDSLFDERISSTFFKTMLPTDKNGFIRLDSKSLGGSALVKWKSAGYSKIIIKDGAMLEDVVWMANIAPDKMEIWGDFSNVRTGLFSVELYGAGKEELVETFTKLYTK